MPKPYPKNAKAYYTFFKVPSSEEFKKKLKEYEERIKDKIDKLKAKKNDIH